MGTGHSLQAAINPSWDFAASGFDDTGQPRCKALGPRDTADAIIWRAVAKNEVLPVKQVGPKGEKRENKQKRVAGWWIHTLETGEVGGVSWRPRGYP